VSIDDVACAENLIRYLHNHAGVRRSLRTTIAAPPFSGE